MKLSFLVLATLSLTLAYASSHSDPTLKQKRKLIARGRTPGEAEHIEPEHPYPQLPKSSPDTDSVDPAAIRKLSDATPPWKTAPNTPVEWHDAQEHPGNTIVYGEDGWNTHGDALDYAMRNNPDLKDAIYKPPGADPQGRDHERVSAGNKVEGMQSPDILSPTPRRHFVQRMEEMIGKMETVIVKVNEEEANRRLGLMGRALRGITSYFSYSSNGGNAEHSSKPVSGKPISGWQPPDNPKWDAGLPIPVTYGNGRRQTFFERLVSGPEPGRRAAVRRGEHLDRVTKRSNPVDPIVRTESDPDPKNGFNLRSDFQTYLNAFKALQAQVSDTIFPFLDTMTRDSNSSLLYNAAWSIYCDLTGTSPYVIGPFSYGRNCLEHLEDRYIAATSSSMSDPVVRWMFAVNSVLLTRYNDAWGNATAALNQSGLLDTIVALSERLAPEDPAVLPAGYKTYQPKNYDSRFFLSHNKTIVV